MTRRLARTLALVLPSLGMLQGCARAIGTTLVSGKLEPKHFRFVTVVNHQGEGPGGWRAACIHVHVKRTTGESYICRFGIEMPLVTAAEGPISTPMAQRIAADSANVAAHSVFRSTTPATPLGLACESFRATYGKVLYGAIRGSSVPKQCNKKTEPVEFGP